MGLDLVEMVMEVEQRFQIEIPDRDAEHIRTVGDLSTYVWKNVQSRDTGLPRTCQKLHLFNTLRRLMVETGHVPRADVRLEFPLSRLAPKVRRQLWKALSGNEFYLLPALDSSRLGRLVRSAVILMLLGTLFLVTPYSIAVASDSRSPIPVLAALGVVGVFLGLENFLRQLRSRVPQQCATVAGLIQACCPPESLNGAPASDQANEDYVRSAVYHIVACQAGVPVERVHWNSRFIEDLNLG